MNAFLCFFVSSKQNETTDSRLSVSKQKEQSRGESSSGESSESSSEDEPGC